MKDKPEKTTLEQVQSEIDKLILGTERDKIIDKALAQRLADLKKLGQDLLK